MRRVWSPLPGFSGHIGGMHPRPMREVIPHCIAEAPFFHLTRPLCSGAFACPVQALSLPLPPFSASTWHWQGPAYGFLLYTSLMRVSKRATFSHLSERHILELEEEMCLDSSEVPTQNLTSFFYARAIGTTERKCNLCWAVPICPIADLKSKIEIKSLQ